MAFVVFCIIATLMCVIGIFGFVKNDNAYRNRMLILEAIGAYAFHEIDKGNYDYREKVYFDDMESYEKTWLRFWDWGYEHILPPEKFEIIKPYIEEIKEEKR